MAMVAWRETAAALRGRDGLQCGSSRQRQRSQIDTERLAQATAPRRRHAHRAAVALTGEPAELQATAPDFGADKTGEVIAPLAPIEAGAAENPSAGRFRRKLNPEL